MWRKNINLTNPDYEEKVWDCSNEIGAVGMTPSNPQWVPPNSSSSLADKVNFQFCVHYYEPLKQALTHPQCCWSEGGTASIQASKQTEKQPITHLKPRISAEPTDTNEKSYSRIVFLLKLMWFTRNDLAQGLQTFFSEGQVR